MKEKVLILLIALGIVLRFIKLDYSPPSLSNDEISIAYDAYSISKTLKDQHNHFLPLAFQSNGDYKVPLYIYMSIPSIELLGNTEYAVRLPSALLGSLTIVILGLLIFELTKNKTLALISSAVLSLTPWHIYTSRMGLESNAALFFLTLGIYLFFLGKNLSRFWIIIFAFISFGLSVWSYHTEWVLTPMLILTLLLIYQKQIKKTYILSGCLIFLIAVSPLYLNNLYKNPINQARSTTEFINKEPYLSSQLENSNLNIIWKSQASLAIFLRSYSSYANLGYLFFDGLGLTNSEDPFQTGLFLFPLLPALILGLVKLTKIIPKDWKFLYSWILLSPIVPSLTIGGVNNIRNLVSVVPLSIAIASGIYYLINNLKNRALILIGSLLLIVSFIYFLILYFCYFPLNRGENFQYGYKQVAQYLKLNQGYQKIVIDPRFGFRNVYTGIPQIYIAYFTQMDPSKLQLSKDLKTGLYFDNYEVRVINWDGEVPKSGYLYVTPHYNLPIARLMPTLEKIYQVNSPNNQIEFELYRTKNPGFTN